MVVTGGNFGEMVMHFIEKYGMMAIRIPSKFDLRRFCKATSSTALIKFEAPKPEELGFAKVSSGRAMSAALLQQPSYRFSDFSA